MDDNSGLFLKNIRSGASDARDRYDRERHDRYQEQPSANRTGCKDRGASLRQHQRAAQIFLQHRTQHEGEKQRRRLEFQFHEQIAKQAEKRQRIEIEGVAVML